MQDNKGIDPTLAVYAAYAYHDLQQIGRIAEMSDYLRRDVGATFFDVELLARRLGRRKLDRGNRVVPFLPMLGQGWALLSAHGIQLHPELQAVAHSVKDSLWTLYDAIGCDTLRKLMATGEFL
jgi:hypothetical protein